LVLHSHRRISKSKSVNTITYYVKILCFLGDRLTDERIQGAQRAMANAGTGKERLEGFISKIEDWHRMMNFLEVINV
jgi:hypothetical protein